MHWWVLLPVPVECLEARYGEPAGFVPRPSCIGDDVGTKVVPFDYAIPARSSPGMGSSALTPRTASMTSCTVPIVINFRH